MIRACIVCCTIILLSVIRPASAQPASPEAPPLLVQGAMPIEVERLVSHLDHASAEDIGGWTFWRGTVDGYAVIVSKTLKGGANAAAATALAIERYHPLAIINQGTAGGHDRALQLFDIVLGTSSVSIAAFHSPYRAAGAGTNPLVWRPIDLNASPGSAVTTAPSIGRFAGDATLLDVARGITKSYTRGHIVEGVIATSDIWNDEVDLIARFHRDFGTSVEEMETAPAAHIAEVFHVPFLGIRIVSDNITNGAAYNPATSDACEDFVFEVVKAYIARIRAR